MNSKPIQSMKGKFAYVTLFSQDPYLPGVVALERSLKRVDTMYQLIVIITPTVTSEAISTVQTEGCLVRMVETFRPEHVEHGQYVRALYAECWNKLRMWEWEEYGRLIYLDADMVVQYNIDALFNLPPAPLHAVGDCYGGRETQEERDSCCFFRPEHHPDYFNAGFYVMRPSKEEFAEMKTSLAKGTMQSGRFAEQDFLNNYFKGKWKCLPYIFNAQKRIKTHHPSLWKLEDIFVIHYVDEKPWSHRCSAENKLYRDIVEFWWEVYETRDIRSNRALSEMAGSIPPLEEVVRCLPQT
jgi:inositol 3-alpha-galactosyltransferase